MSSAKIGEAEESGCSSSTHAGSNYVTAGVLNSPDLAYHLIDLSCVKQRLIKSIIRLT